MRHRQRWRIFRFMHTALTIAGSDSGGGAGIQADLKTFFRFGVFGTSAITAITAQNTRGVASWEPVSAELVRAQIDAVASDLRPGAVKSGMIGTRQLVHVVAESHRVEIELDIERRLNLPLEDLRRARILDRQVLDILSERRDLRLVLVLAGAISLGG